MIIKKTSRTLQNGGLFNLAAARHPLSAEGTVYRVDLEKTIDTEQALLLIGRSCHFPDGYGANLDALYDCLTDWDGDNAIVFFHDQTWRSADPTGYRKCLRVLAKACRQIRASGGRLTVYFDRSDP